MGTIPKDENKRLRTSTNEIPGIEELDERLKSQRRELIEKWVQQLPDWFPHLCIKTYFIPPIHVNKMTKYDDLGLCPTDPTFQGQGQRNVLLGKTRDGRQAFAPTTDVTESRSQASVRPSATEGQGQTKNRPSVTKGQGQGHATGAVRVGETKQSDYRDDRAQLLVERFFWTLSQKRQQNDVMVVLSKLSLDNYLNKTLSGASGQKKKGKKGKKANNEPKAKEFFPSPTDPKLQRGDFDLLIVHKEYGFIIIEIKAIGDQDYELKSLEDHLGDKEIADVLTQLHRRNLQLEELIADLGGPKIPVKKLAAFPSVKRDKLKHVMMNPKYAGALKPKLEQYLDNDPDLDKALNLWLCEDEVNRKVTSAGDDVTLSWWSGLLGSMKVEHFTGMDDDLYKQLVARFCGPLSTVEVCRQGGAVREARSVADAVHEMSTCFYTFVLRKEQMEWLWSPEDYVYLTGPPGSGKTLLLLLKAVNWVQEGDNVVVVRGPGNLPGHPISQVLHHQIISTLNDESLAEMVHLETITAWTDPGKFVEEMLKNAKGTGKVRFLVDELWLAKPSGKILSLVREVLELLGKVKDNVESDCSDAIGSLAMSSPQAPTATTDTVMTEEISRDLPRAEEKTGQKISEALCQINKRVKSWSSISDVARSILTDEINEVFNTLSSAVHEIQTLLSVQAKPSKTHSNVEEKVSDVLFYVDVLASWLASPVLHGVMQEARRHDDAGLWCTGFWPNRCPDEYKLAKLSTSIRCPAHVQALLDQTELLASHKDTKQYQYVTTSTQENPPLPAEGPPCAMLTYIDHGLHVHHETELHCVSECEECGNQLACVLLDKLCVGKEGSKLQFRDVLVVGRALLPIKPDSAFIQALRGAPHRIPVSVVVRGCDDLQEGQLESDTVLVTNTYSGHGLERAVVVFVPDIKFCHRKCGEDGDRGGGDGDWGDGEGGSCGGSAESEKRVMNLGENNLMGMWFIASRCLGHVVIFHV